MNPPDYSQPNQPSQQSQPTDYQAPQSSDQPVARNPLAVMQPGEQIICQIKRHPIGIFGIYAAVGLLLVVLAVLAFVIAPNVFGEENRSQVMVASSVSFIIITILSLVFVFISNYVYWGNTWEVTSDSLTQVTQTSLFSRQSSQLSLGNLEDVTTEKNGILAQLLNFGVLKAETAGERSKFVFLYCPNPNYYAQKILAAREQFELIHHGGKQEPTVVPDQTQVATAAPPPAYNPAPPLTPELVDLPAQQPPTQPNPYQPFVPPQAPIPPSYDTPISQTPYPVPPSPDIPNDQSQTVIPPDENQPAQY